MTKLVSIKKKYSDLIYSRKKKVEYRRQNVNVQSGERFYVYTSSPARAITGYFVVEKKLRLPLQALWNATKRVAGIARKEFFEYFAGCTHGTALVFSAVKRFIEALPLECLRERFGHNGRFSPPQSYFSIGEDTPLFEHLEELRSSS